MAGPTLGLLLAGAVVSVCAVAIGRIERAAGGYRADEPLEIVIVWPSGGPGDASGGGAGTDGPDGLNPTAALSWLPVSMRDELLTLAQEAAGLKRDPFSPAPLLRVREALGATGWFDELPTVERTGSDQITVRGAWRLPIVWVAVGQAAYLVDRHGRLLPPIRQLDELGPMDRLVVNPAWDPPKTDNGKLDAQTSWRGQDVAAAIDLVVLLWAQAYWDQVARIDLDRFFDDQQSPRLVIVTDTGSRIVWGGPTGVFNPGEVADSIKLARLAHFHESPSYNHHIDAGIAGYDLWSHEVELMRAPVPTDGSP